MNSNNFEGEDRDAEELTRRLAQANEAEASLSAKRNPRLSDEGFKETPEAVPTTPSSPSPGPSR